MTISRLKNPSNWYLAGIRPNQHRIAITNLERQGYGCFLPQHMTTKRRGRRLANTLSPLFPGYVFVQIGTDCPWRPVQATYGVRTLVMRAANVPQPVPDCVMSDLLECAGPDGLIDLSTNLTPGDEVHITAGPMVGFVATVERLDQSDRVSVLLKVMGQAVRTNVSRKHVLRSSV